MTASRSSLTNTLDELLGLNVVKNGKMTKPSDEATVSQVSTATDENVNGATAPEIKRLPPRPAIAERKSKRTKDAAIAELQNNSLLDLSKDGKKKPIWTNGEKTAESAVVDEGEQSIDSGAQTKGDLVAKVENIPIQSVPTAAAADLIDDNSKHEPIDIKIPMLMLPQTAMIHRSSKNDASKKKLENRKTTTKSLSSNGGSRQGNRFGSAHSMQDMSNDKQNIESTLHQTNYEIWSRKKLDERRAKEQMEKKIEEDKRRNDDERRLTAQKSYEKWKHDREEELKQRSRLKREQIEKAKAEKAVQDAEKRDAANKAFDAWLKVRTAHDRDLRKQREAHESADRMRRENEEKTKSSDALNVFTAWKQSKDEYIRQMSEEQRNLRREKDQMTDAEREYKATMADEAYRQWLDLKERERSDAMSLQSTVMRYKHAAQNRWPIPWIPPNNTSYNSSIVSSLGRQRRRIRKSLSSINRRTKSAH